MGRQARRREPALPRIRKLELNHEKIGLRIGLFALAIAIAVIAFGYFLSTLLSRESGWQRINPGKTETGCTSQLALMYDIGRDGSATQDYKRVSACFTEAADQAWWALSELPAEQAVNLYDLNANPNTPMQISPILYTALQSILTCESRSIYYAPLMEAYANLYSSDYDEAAASFDPNEDAETLAYAQQILSFANDPAAVSLVLSENDTAELRVSSEYLQFAAENELAGFVAFGWLRNALIVDAVADALLAQGLPCGVVSSVDGFTRWLDDGGEMRVKLCGWNGQAAVQDANILFGAPGSAVSFQNFPLSEAVSGSYYCYDNGVIRGPYIGADGRILAANSNLLALSAGMRCGELALTVSPLFAAEMLDAGRMDALAQIGVELVYRADGVIYAGENVTVEPLHPTDRVEVMTDR